MNTYDILFTFRLQHDYYEGSFCREVNLLPSPDTVRLLKRRGLVLRRMDSHEWAVVNGDSQAGVVPLTEDDCLEFLLLREDPLFQFFTDYPGFSPGKSRKLVPRSRQERIEMNSVILSEEADDRSHVFLRVEVPLGKWLNSQPKESTPWLELHFPARSVYWEYYMVPRKAFVGSLPERDFSLEEQERRIEFGKSSPSEFGGKQVYVFRSKSKVPMKEFYSFQLTFQERVDLHSKTLLRQLPFPSPGLFPCPTPDTLRHVVYF